MKFVSIILFTVFCLCGHGTCEESVYVQVLTQGLKPSPEVPEEWQDIVTQLNSLDIHEMTNVIQTSGFLHQGADQQYSNVKAPLPSPQCANHTSQVLAGLIAKKPATWALQMLDSAGKPGSDLLQLNIVFLGTYEECTGVKATQTINNVTTQMFRGKYCRASIPLAESPATPAAPAPVPGTAVVFGLCFPDSCTGEDVTIILNGFLDLILKQLNITIPFKFGPTICQDENLKWTTKAIVVFVIAMIFVFLLVVSTIYDVVFIQLPQWMMLSAESESLLNGGEGYTSLNIKQRQDETTPLLGAETKIDYSQSEPSLCGKVLLSFSMYTNAKKLLSTRRTAGSLTAVHGIRFLSMSWVILGHTYAFGMYTADNLIAFFPDVLKRWTFQGILNATVSVDSFFVLSGLLVTYLVLKEMKRNNGKINWFMFYFHRFWRLTPPYMLLMMVYIPLFPYVATGPNWSQKGFEINECRDTWWTNLLYINNLVYKDRMCMGWSWYLANDMQFYILSPLIFVPLFFSKILGIISVLTFLLATMMSAGIISRVNDMGPGMFNAMATPTNGTNPPDQMAYFYDYYITPYCRMGPYIIGMVTGYLLYKTDCRVRLNKWIVLCGWCTATASALAVLYGLYDVSQGHPVTVDVAAFYNAVHRTVWGMCLCWVIFACATGYGGFVNTLLSWEAFIPLSRLTYCAYLIHPIVMFFYYLSQRTLSHLTDVNLVYYFFGHMMASYMAAFVVSLAFEAPMMGLEKALLKREKNS